MGLQPRVEAARATAKVRVVAGGRGYGDPAPTVHPGEHGRPHVGDDQRQAPLRAAAIREVLPGGLGLEAGADVEARPGCVAVSQCGGVR